MGRGGEERERRINIQQIYNLKLCAIMLITCLSLAAASNQAHVFEAQVVGEERQHDQNMSACLFSQADKYNGGVMDTSFHLGEQA